MQIRMFDPASGPRTMLLTAVTMLGMLVHETLAQTRAFPGAVGFGAYATGGRGGTVYRVTTLADSGPGSFRDAVSQPNRIIIFDVAGYITLGSEVGVKPNITIAGQTAPGGGIAIRGAEVSFGGSSNIIVRHVRFRPGSSAPTGAHCVNMYQATNVILDHCTFEYGPWNNIGGVNSSEVTIQRCLIADPIYQQFGAHMERLGGRVMWYQCIFANGHNRQPLAKINTVYINNVVYNYEAGYTCGNTSGSFVHDIIGNYFITGPATDTPANDFYQIGSNQRIYEQANLRDSNRNGVLDGTATYVGEGTPLSAPWSSWSTNVQVVSPALAYRRAVSVAGAFPRDAIDQLILREVLSVGVSGPNPLPSSQTRTGLPDNGFGIIPAGTPPLDTDLDGMPDYWELAMGTAVNSNDAMIIEPDGYARIERYLNWLAEPHAVTLTNTPVEIDLSQYVWGFTNAAPVYNLLGVTNGTAVFTATGRVRFTPATGFAGMGGFGFSVTGSDGLSDTGAVAVLVVPMRVPANLVWHGDGVSNVWAVGGPANWLRDGTPATFESGDNVLFDDSGFNTPAVWLSGNIAANSIVVSAAKDYTFDGPGALVGPTSILKTGPGKLTILTTNSLTGSTLIEEGTIRLGDGISRTGSLGGAVTNYGLLEFANPGTLSSALSISGSGNVVKTAGGTLTLSGPQSYTGWTLIEAGTLEFAGAQLPSGVITNNSRMAIKSSVTHSGRITGSGSLTINASGGLVVLGGDNSYAGGTTNAAGTLVLAHNNAAGTGKVYYQSGYVAVGGGVVITNDFSIPGNATTDLMMTATNGTGVWAGNVVELGSGASWRPGADTGGTLIFTGTAHQGTRNFIVPRGAVHFASNAVVTATGSATALGRDGSENNRSANITIRDNAQLLLGACSLGGGKAGGSVTVTIRDNALLSTGPNNLDLNNVTRTTATNLIRLNGGTLEVGGFVKTRTNLATIAFNGGLLRAGANNTAFLPALSYLVAEVQSGGARIDDAGFAITVSAPLVHAAWLGTALDGGLTKLGSGTLTLAGANTYNGPTMVLAGTLRLTTASAVASSTNLYVGAGAVLDVTALGSGGLTIQPGRVLWGNGTVNGNLTIGSGAVLAPGSNTIGRLTVSGNLNLAPGCTNILELLPAASTNDTVVVTGTLTLGGTLLLTNSGGAFIPGQSFLLFDAGTIAGTLQALVLPDPGQGLTWNTNRLYTEGVLRVDSTGPVMFNRVSFSAGTITFSGAGGTPGAEFVVLSHTNVTMPLGTWTPVATNRFDSSGGFQISILTDPADAARYYVIRRKDE